MNLNYDPYLLKIENLKWLPFIGANYDINKNKILLVGESHYYDPKTENNNFEKQEFTRMIVDEMALNSLQYGSPFFNRISELLNYLDRIELWSGTSFYNFIQKPMNKGEKAVQGVIERPTKKDFEDGWKIYFDVIKITKPNFCIFFGSTSANYFNKACVKSNVQHKEVIREEKINGSYLKRSELLIDEHKTELIFIKHPSSYFSTNLWRAALNEKVPKIAFSSLPPRFSPTQDS